MSIFFWYKNICFSSSKIFRQREMHLWGKKGRFRVPFQKMDFFSGRNARNVSVGILFILEYHFAGTFLSPYSGCNISTFLGCGGDGAFSLAHNVNLQYKLFRSFPSGFRIGNAEESRLSTCVKKCCLLNTLHGRMFRTLPPRT